ncbi:nitroreductase family protein [Melghirimyces algeriensis]|uniref:Putative NAD(P)H nitroreductase n=1 Tax=Melghirimyces algeriensis TaxID=910412 RepID=A0A521DP83_9BACL|nr:nitroreductase [Melghirimyces algeriensis]SMO73549.1 Nitroreductase [Melghirimyces algeriensis]
MQLGQAIRTRRSIGKVSENLPERELIEKILEAARWAPNHHMTQPWKYFVLTGDARTRLGEVMKEIKAESMTEDEKRDSTDRLEREAKKPLRAPVLIAAAVTPSDDPKVEEIEEVCAVAAGIQNALLMAHALGLGAIWRTGKPTYHPRMKQFFGLKERDTLLGFLYIGYPAIQPKERPRSSLEEKVEWWDQ